MALAVTADAVRTLHRMHRQLEDLRSRLAAGPRAIDARSRNADTITARLGVLQEEIRKARLVADQKQLQLRSMETRIKDCESKRNAAKTNREYQLLGEQMAADDEAKKVLEDEILEALERVDGLKANQAPIEAELAAAKAALEEMKGKVQAERGALDAEVARIAADLERAEQDLPNESRESYRRMVRSKGADAMAQLDGESCGGCCQQLPPNAVAELSQGRVVPCRSCGRMVYASRSD
jgi:predicted  nucleic acid-binding Zn-ribbon protein